MKCSASKQCSMALLLSRCLSKGRDTDRSCFCSWAWHVVRELKGLMKNIVSSVGWMFALTVYFCSS